MISRGFTLIELLVVVAIISILTLIGISVFAGTQSTARDGKRIMNVDAVANALEGHFHAASAEYECIQDSFFSNGSSIYKDPLTGNNFDLPGCSSIQSGSTGAICSFNSSLLCYSSWKVCATLEKANAGNQAKPCNAGSCQYCRKNQQ